MDLIFNFEGLGELVTYSRFHTFEEAEGLIQFLQNAGIPYELNQETPQLDPLIIGHSFDPLVSVLIPADRFSEVNFLLEKPVRNEFKPEPLQSKWVFIGYLFSIIPLAGFFAGLALVGSNKTLGNGRHVKMYDKKTILHGKIMMGIAAVCTILFFMIRSSVSGF